MSTRQIKTQTFPELTPKFDNKVGVIEIVHNADEARRAFIVAANRLGYTLTENNTMRDGWQFGRAAVMLP